MGDRRRRRRLAAAITVAGLTFGTAACGSGSDNAGGGGPNTLEVWTRSDPDSAATYDRVFAAFTKKTGIKVDYKPVVNFDQQLQSRASTKDLPDVTINDTALMGSYQSQGLLKPIDQSRSRAATRSPARAGRPQWAATAGTTASRTPARP